MEDSPTSDVILSGDQTPNRFSDLPDLIIVQILSYLHFEEAVRTTLLSKRFYSLWNSVTRLNFSDEISRKNASQFVSFVDAALGFHLGRSIEKFSLQFCYNSMYSDSVDRWINFATKKYVKFLHLNLAPNLNSIGDNNEHKLPEFLCCNDKLEELVTNCCLFKEIEVISWSSLKFLSIAKTRLNEELISMILRGCPVLEILELRDWSGFDSLRINSVSLKGLRIVGEQRPAYFIQPMDECLFEISGPNLLSLEISGHLYRTKVQLTNLWSLMNATMDFEIRPRGNRASFLVRDQDIAREVLDNLCFVSTLTVGVWFLKVLSTWEKYNIPFPRSERKKLILCLPVIKGDNHRGITSLLHSSPLLKTLNITLTCCSNRFGLWSLHPPCNNYKKECCWSSWITVSNCSLMHLKTVKVMNFRAWCGGIKVFSLLHFLLRNSKVLEEVVIQVSQHVSLEAFDEGMKLLSVPTASPDVVLKFEPPYFWVPLS